MVVLKFILNVLRNVFPLSLPPIVQPYHGAHVTIHHSFWIHICILNVTCGTILPSDFSTYETSTQNLISKLRLICGAKQLSYLIF